MALAVTTKMKEIIRQRDAEIISGQDAIEKLLLELKKQIVAELATIPQIDSGVTAFGAYQLKQSLVAVEAHISNFDTAAKNELKSRLNDSWELGQSLLPEAAKAAGMQLNTYWLSSDVLTSLQEYAFTKISKVTTETMFRIKGELSLGVLGAKTPQQVAGELAGQLKGYDIPKRKDRWGKEHPIFKSVAERAEVITGLEMGRAFSMATEKSIAAGQETLPELQRMWLHAGHPKKSRQVHVLMHGQVRKVGKPFFQSIDGKRPVYYPRAPDAPISEVIRCGCTHVPYHPDWGSKEEFVTDWKDMQEAANKPKGPYQRKEK